MSTSLTAYNRLVDECEVRDQIVELLASNEILTEIRVMNKKSGKIEDRERIIGNNLEAAAKEILT